MRDGEMIESKTTVNEMTLEEKARLVCGATFFGMADIPRLNVPRMQLLDGGTGINFEQLFGDMADLHQLKVDSTNGMVGSTVLMHVIEYFFEPEKLNEEELELRQWIKEHLEKNLNGVSYAPGCFPPGILLGATWDPKVIYQVGEALGREANLYGVHILLGTPNVNIHRDPLNGRLFEGYSEDPCLVSKLAPELVKGVQTHGVAANVKHFAANNQETNRVGINEWISERALEEIYLPGFRACVQEGKVQTVMSAYNKINGVPCTENRWLLTEELRENWGFDGVVLSDWGAVYHPVEALAAGNDLAMPGPIDYRPIYDAVKSGKLEEAVLDQAVERLLNMIHWISGHFRKEAFSQKEVKELHRFTDKAAYDAAASGIVLLENQEIFPLKEGQKVAIVGSGAEKLMECGSGSAGITTNRTSSLYDCLKKQLGEENVYLNEIPSDTDVVLCVSRLGGMEGNDRKDLQLPKEDLELFHKLGAVRETESTLAEENTLIEENIAGKKSVAIILNTCGPVDLSSLNRDVVKGVFAMFLPGMEGGHAMADILTGKVNPSGKLPLTFPARYEDTPTYLNFPGDGYEVNYGEGIYVGYRYYDKKKIKPLYPFGYGMSYTKFTIDNLCISKDCICANTFVENICVIKDKYAKSCPVVTDQIDFSVDVTNVGQRDGAEVVQIYIRDVESTLAKPVKELKAFQKVFLKAGEKKTIDFVLDKRDLASYDGDRREWIAEEGYYEILVATSSAGEDIKESFMVYLESKTPYSYGMDSTVKTIYEHPQLKELAVELWKAEGWDMGILESNYQYTSNKLLIDIVPDKNAEAIKVFIKKAGCVKKR